MPDYDAFLLVSFGGPEGPDDVMPFLRNVTRGRGIPEDRLEAVAEHYYAVGGVSPINQQCRDLIPALRTEFGAARLDLPIYWGNRNWDPYLTDTVAAMAADGVRHALAFATSAYSSFSSCRQYLDDIDRAREHAGPGAPRIDKIRRYFNHPGFVEPFAENARAALATLPADARDGARLVFTAHSVPLAMAAHSGPPGKGTPRNGALGPGGRYAAELTETASLIAERTGGGAHPWDLVYQSRSGPPSQPWLEPDVLDHLGDLAKAGAPAAVIIPVGFVSDHMEVRHDLDTEAAETAAALGLPVARAATPWYHPQFRAMIVDLVRERLGPPDAPRAALGRLGPSTDACPPGCCAFARPAGDPPRSPAGGPARSGTGRRGSGRGGRGVNAPRAEDLLALAADAAAAAARLLADEGAQSRPEVVETKSSLTDVVTEMDRRAEALITERIRAERPGDAILGEEGGETHGGRGQDKDPGEDPGEPGDLSAPVVRWIVDPLDGTVNYLYGLADWAVSIAAEVAGTIVAGVVAVPLHGETFTAIRGQGAWLHSTADRASATGEASATGGRGAAGLRCNRGVPLGQALVGTGFGYLPGRRRVQGEVVATLLPQIRDIRRGGSASVDLCMVAAGRLDAFYERGLNYWDYAAGGLIAEEAGARVTGLEGRPADTSLTVAAGPGLYEELTAFLATLNPERDA